MGVHGMTVTILTGDAVEMMRALPDQSVQCIITSPPYYQQRAYLAVDDPARRLERGRETSPEAFVDGLVDVFREARRVLRDDGTLWVNIGDTAASSGRGGGGSFQHTRAAWSEDAEPLGYRETAGVPRRNKLLIPFRFALAMQADGWVVRQDNVWSKPNCFPESINDRTTTAHEYMFHFAKPGPIRLWRARDDGTWSRTKPPHELIPNPSTNPEVVENTPAVNRWVGFSYYYEADAIAEQSSPNTHARVARGRSEDAKYADGGPRGQTIAGGRVSAGRKRVGAGIKGETVDHEVHGRVRSNADFMEAVSGEILPMRNKRSVWEVPTAKFDGNHFATFPPALVEPCVLAGCPRGGVVLDMFAGGGTVGQVAEKHGRDSIMIDLDHRNVEMMERRLHHLPLALPFA